MSLFLSSVALNWSNERYLCSYRQILYIVKKHSEIFQSNKFLIKRPPDQYSTRKRQFVRSLNHFIRI